MASSTHICGVDNSLTFGSDPSPIDTINAAATYGGISVSWQYPSSNAHSIAHFILYRSQGSTPTEYARVKSSGYFDSMSQAYTGKRFNYWVRWVSVNGTTGALLGPASAVAGSLTGDILSLLSGQILRTHLAESLRTEIEDIPSLRNELISEQTGRLLAVEGLENTLSGLGYDVSQTFAAIDTERRTRIDGMNAMASEIGLVAASNGQNWSAIVTERESRVSAVEAVSRDITTQASVFNGELGRVESVVQQESETRSTETSALASRVDTLAVNINGMFAGYINDIEAGIDENGGGVSVIEQLEVNLIRPIQDNVDQAVTDIGTLETDIGTLESGLKSIPNEITGQIHNYESTRAGYCELPNGDISTNHTDKQSCEAANGTWKSWLGIADSHKRLSLAIGDPGDNEMSIAQRMTISEDDLGRLQGKYTVKINTTRDGQKLMGGFGIANEFASNDPDGPEAATDDIIFGVVADKFFIAQPHENVLLPGTGVNGVAPQILPERMPFIVDGGTVYMNSAYIKDLSVDTLKIKRNSITKSYRYDSGSQVFRWTGGSGWDALPPIWTISIPRITPWTGSSATNEDVHVKFTVQLSMITKAKPYSEFFVTVQKLYLSYFIIGRDYIGDWQELEVHSGLLDNLNKDTPHKTSAHSITSTFSKYLPEDSLIQFCLHRSKFAVWGSRTTIHPVYDYCEVGGISLNIDISFR